MIYIFHSSFLCYHPLRFQKEGMKMARRVTDRKSVV